MAQRDDLIQYLVETQGATPEEAAAYIDEVGEEAAIAAFDSAPATETTPEKGLNLGGENERTLKKIFNALDATGSAGRKAVTQAIDAAAGTNLDEGTPEYKDIGQYPSSAQIMEKAGVPSGPPLLEVAKYHPQFALPLLALDKMGFKPDVRDAAGVVGDVVTDPMTLLSAVPKFIDPLRKGVGRVAESVGKRMYRSPLAKLDQVILETNPNAMRLSDIGYANEITGDWSQIRDGLKKVQENTWKGTLHPMMTEMNQKGFTFNADEAAEGIRRGFETNTFGENVGLNQRPFIQDKVKEIKDEAVANLKSFKPTGWKDKVKEYQQAFKGYLKDKKAFEAAGGRGEQPSLFGFEDGQRTVEKDIVVPLRGQDPNVPQVEPYEVWTQPELPTLPTKQNQNAFNPLDAQNKLLPMAQQMSLDQIGKDILSKLPTEGGAYQGSILNLGVVPESSTIARVKGTGTRAGQGTFQAAPKKPERPRRDMSIWETLANKKDAQTKVQYKAFGEKGATPNKELEATLQSPIADLFKTKIEEGAEQLLGKGQGKRLTEANRLYGTISQALPELSTQVVREAGTPNLTPMEIGFMTNPYTAPMAVTKEAVERMRLPKFMTGTGINLKRQAADLMKKSSYLSNLASQATPYYLMKNADVMAGVKSREELEAERARTQKEIEDILDGN